MSFTSWLRHFTSAWRDSHPAGRLRPASRTRRSRPEAELLEDRTLLSGVLQFGQAAFGVGENAGAATVTVTRSGDLGTAASVRFATSDGTATAGADYTAASGALTFAPGETSRTFVVSIQSDAVVEGTESVSLALSDPGDAMVGPQSTAVLFVADPVRPTVPDEMLRVAYLIPSNRAPQPRAITNLQFVVRQYQAWYRDQMERYGFGPKTFVYETQADGVTPVIYMVFVAPTDADLRGAGAPIDLYNNNLSAARAGGVPVLQTPGQNWLLLSESHQLNPDGSMLGNLALGASFGSGSDPGVGQIGSNALPLFNPAMLSDDRAYDGLVIPDIGPYPLRQGVSFASFSGSTVSSISSSAMGAAIHEFSHGFGLPHDFRNDQTIHGNLMGNGFRGFRNEVFPARYPTDETRLTYAEALTLNVSRYFNPSLVVTDNVRPTISVQTSGSVVPENGLVRIDFTASDAGGLAVAVLRLNGEAVEELPLTGSDVTTSFLTTFYTPGQSNNYTISVHDLQGNRQNASFTLTPASGFNRAPRPSFKLLASTVEIGQTVTLDASATTDPNHTASSLTVEWDVDGNGTFDTAPTTTKTLTQVFTTAGTRLIRVRVTDPAGAQTVSAPLALRITPPNSPPTISDVFDRSIEVNTSSGFIDFIVGDAETLADALLVSAVSSNPVLVPAASIVFGGGGAARTVTVTPAAGQTGTAVITLTVRDGNDGTASDNFTLTVFEGGLRVGLFAPTSTGFIVNFNQPIDTAVLNLYEAQPLALGPADVALNDGSGNPVRGSLVVAPNGRGVTFIRSGAPLLPGTYTALLRSADNGFRVQMTGELLDGNGDGIPGGDYTTTFTVAATSAVVVSVPDFLRGPGQRVDVPAPSMGLPLRLSAPAGVTSVSLTLRYDSRLLTITGGSVTSGLPMGASVTVNTSAPSTAIINFTSPPLSSEPTEFVRLTAIVPDSAGALYTQKHLLDLTSISINGGAIPALDDDGLHVNAYFGDTTGNAGYSATDATRALRVAVGLDSGFSAYQSADPLLIADITANGALNSTDATRILQEAIGIDQALIPPLPGVIPPIVLGGPDPLLSLPRNLRGRPGQQITVPVNLDQPEGLEVVDLALSFDPTLLEVVAVHRGPVTRDFDVFAVNVDPVAGTIQVGLGRTVGPLSGRRGGSVLAITFRVRADAPAGQAVVNLRRELGPTTTQLNEGGLDLNPDPSNQAGGVLDGIITVARRRPSTQTSGKLRPRST